MGYDLLLKGGRVYDPAQKLDVVADIAITGDKISAITPNLKDADAKQTVDVSGQIVTPGLVDVHVHTFRHHDPEGLPPDSIGVHDGVTSICDQGSAGVYTFQSFRKHITEPAYTAQYNYITPSTMCGVIQGKCPPALISPDNVDIDAAIELIKQHPDLIKGLKVSGNPVTYSYWGDKMMRMARYIADQTGIGIYVHCGMADVFPVLNPETFQLKEALPKQMHLLRPGDVLGHIASDYKGGLMENNKVTGPALEAIARGVLVDIGHGCHFSFPAARGMMEQGVLPSLIGSDQHAPYWSPNRPVPSRSNTSLVLLMSKMMALGMTLEQVITRTTADAAKVLRISDKAGSLKVGGIADVSVLNLAEGKFRYRDPAGETAEGRQRLIAVLCTRRGRPFFVNPGLLNSYESFQDEADRAGGAPIGGRWHPNQTYGQA